MKTKSRSAGATTTSNQDSESMAKEWLANFERDLTFQTDRKAKLEDMMRRKKAKNWGPEKKAQMVRRLMMASKAIEFDTQTIELLKRELGQATSASG